MRDVFEALQVIVNAKQLDHRTWNNSGWKSHRSGSQSTLGTEAHSHTQTGYLGIWYHRETNNKRQFLKEQT